MEGPHGGQKAKPLYPVPTERLWELGFDTRPLETSYTNLNPDPQTAAGLLSPPSLGTLGWHLLHIGIHSTFTDLISCICVQTNRSFFTEGSKLLLYVWLTKTLLNRAVPSLQFADFRRLQCVQLILPDGTNTQYVERWWKKVRICSSSTRLCVCLSMCVRSVCTEEWCAVSDQKVTS